VPDPGELRVTAVPGGVLVDVRLRPRSSRAGVVGVREGALELRVTAPPVEGEANAAARDLLAELLGVPRGAVALAAGARGRRKTFRVDGLDAAAARARAAAALAGKSP
jgi:uncharacterized protein (TIGR00251 family)